MRFFQNSGLYPAYLRRLRALTRGIKTFSGLKDAFLNDRYAASHFLLPVLNNEPSAFFTNGDDSELQRAWANEHGLTSKTPLEDILIAQLEHHRAEVFYNVDPLRYPSSFLRRLPGCVKRKIAWWAAPAAKLDFDGYDLMVCNFPSLLDKYQQRGWPARYFTPAHDPVMDEYANNEHRPIDVLFVGGYSRHHTRRAAVLESVAELKTRHNVVFSLDASRGTRWAESLLGRLLPLRKHRRPKPIRAVSAPPVFGRDLYRAISQAKIVLNGAVDMVGRERGNMRCWEAMGCGALMVSDEGVYPDAMTPQLHFVTYNDATDAVQKIRTILQDFAAWRPIAERGYETVRSQYSKEKQWADFQVLAA